MNSLFWNFLLNTDILLSFLCILSHVNIFISLYESRIRSRIVSMFGVKWRIVKGNFGSWLLLWYLSSLLGVYQVEILTLLSGVDLECLVEQWMIIGMSWEVIVVIIIYLRENCKYSVSKQTSCSSFKTKDNQNVCNFFNNIG